MSATQQDDTSNTSHFPAPSWATSSHDDRHGIITWSHRVELTAVEVHGWASLTVAA
jgi:hypothetical protein